MTASTRTPRRGHPLRVVVGGAFARVPGQGGLVWMVLHWVLGLRALGHHVTLIEPLSREDLVPAESGLTESTNAAFFRRSVRPFGLRRDAALVLDRTDCLGLTPNELRRRLLEADVLIDVAGGLSAPELGLAEILGRIPVRVYLDVDPGFTQLWHAVEGIDMRFDHYSHFATVGLSFEQDGHGLPRCGRDWISTAPPVALEHWPVAPAIEGAALTTVAHWRGYGSIVVDGRHFGQKAHSFRELIELPLRAAAPIELALAIDPGEPDDLAALAANGWTLRSPADVASSAEGYRHFVRRSRGELGVAKSGYVEARCGWFSDRSVCYLASGLPVLAQDTGFSDCLPVGEGLFAFRTVDDVCAALESLERDEPRHRRAARAIAEEHFAADRIAGALLERAGVAA